MRWHTVRATYEYDLYDGETYVGSIERLSKTNPDWEARDADGCEIVGGKQKAMDWLLNRRAEYHLHANHQEYLTLARKYGL